MKIKGKNLYIIFTLFYAYFILAIFESARGSFIPFFISDFSIDNTTMAIIISVSQFGGVIGCFLAGNLSFKYGQKVTLIAGIIICIAVCLSAKFVQSPVMLCVFYTVFTFGRCLLCVSVDTLVPAITIGVEVLVVNLTHFMYGFGSFVGQRIYGFLLQDNILWKNIYFYLSTIFIIGLVLILFIKQPSIQMEKSSMENGKRELYRNPLLYLFTICFGFNSAGELLMTTWFINYMSSSYSFTPLMSSNYSSMFFMTFAIGRLLGGIIIQKIGTEKGLKICIGFASLSVLAGLILKESGLIILALSGIFFSVTYPSLIVLINATFKEFAPIALGIITTINFMIDMSCNVFIGYLNDVVGSYKAFFLVPVMMAVAFILLVVIYKRKNVTNCT